MAPSQRKYGTPITLRFAPDDGDIIGGTVNGVEVNGQWIGELKYAILYRGGNTDVPLCNIEFFGGQAFVTVEQDSAPTTDYELHLYRHVPSGIVQIPQEYVEGLEETTANANQALETATAAKSTAESSRIAPNAYNYDAIQVSCYGKYKGWFESIPKLEYDTTNGKFHKSQWEKDALTYENIPKTFVIEQYNLQLGLGSEKIYMICCKYSRSSPNEWKVVGVGIGETGSHVTAETQYISSSESTGFVFKYTSPQATILRSSTPNSTKKFKITVDDTGTISATEVA